VAFDGDADRAIFSDEAGRILDGDDVLWILARDWKRQGLLTEAGIVGTVMSNFGLEAGLAREGIAFRRAAVGDRNVARLMEESGALIGGETSGHLILPFSPAGDGIQTALLLAGIAARAGGPLSWRRSKKCRRSCATSVSPDAWRSKRTPVSRAPSPAPRRARSRRGARLFRAPEPLLRSSSRARKEAVAAIADELGRRFGRNGRERRAILAILFDAEGLINVDGRRVCAAADLPYRAEEFADAEAAAVGAVRAWILEHPDSTD
jgi:phosphoglucosamine mutase